MKKIMIVEDSPRLLEKIAAHVNNHTTHQLLATAHDGYELIRFCYSQKILPDIVLLDVMMPKFDGVSTMEYLNAHFPQVRAIALSSHTSQRVVIDMMAAGARGYVMKDLQLSLLSEALSVVAKGGVFIDPRLLLDVSDHFALVQKRKHEREQSFASFRISEREQQVLGLIISNIDYAQIGEILHLAPKTVENIVTNLVKKMQTSNGRSGLLLQSVRLGMTKMMSPGSVLY